MKDLYKIIKESILDDEDVIIDNMDKILIENFIKDNYKYKSIKISDKPNKDGKYEVSSDDVYVENENITSLTNGLFVWNVIDYGFDCNSCDLLTSLEGAPKKVGEDFKCYSCNSLTSLNGAPKEVGRDFDCRYCKSLKSLNGAPKEIVGDFDCRCCNSLQSLEGAPKKVGRDFYCQYCKSLKSLNGAPKEIKMSFYCSNCKVQFTEDDVRNVSNVKRKIVC